MRESSKIIVERLFKTHKTTTILKNPSLKELSDITDSGKKSIRFIALNFGKNVYVWVAAEKSHDDISSIAGAKWPDSDTFYGEAKAKGNRWIGSMANRFLPERVRNQLRIKDWSWLNKYSIDISGALKLLGK